MNIFPAIDLINWEVVRLIKWDYNNKIEYNPDPLLVSQIFSKKWFSNLHIIDLDWAKAKMPMNLKIIKKIKENSNCYIQVWWWIRTIENILNYLEIWIDRIILGSSAIIQHGFWNNTLEFVDKKKLALSLDVDWWVVKINWWEQWTNYTIHNVIEKIWLKNISNLIVTDITKDWTMSWVDIWLYLDLVNSYQSLNIIPAWWVSSMNDIFELEKIWIKEIIIWRAFYENELFQSQVLEFINKNNE